MIIKIIFGVGVFLFVILMLVLILPEILYLVIEAFEKLADLIRELRYQMQKSKIKKTKVKPATNFDRIKAMSVAQMVDFIERIELGDIDYSITFCDLCQGDNDCTDCIKKWLEAEYKESGDLG